MAQVSRKLELVPVLQAIRIDDVFELKLRKRDCGSLSMSAIR